MPTSTVEDYLKVILRLSDGERGLIALGKVAKELGITSGTATTMMKYLDEQRYVRYVPRQGVSLSEKGYKVAMQVLRRHRLVETFLVEVLKLDWTEVHEEAEILEHTMSDRLINRIDEMLGLPARDPHGDPIPDANGVLREDQTLRLDKCKPGKYQLIKVTRTNTEFLSWLSTRGLIPGTHFMLMGHDTLADLFSVTFSMKKTEQDIPIQFGRKVAEELWVLPVSQ